MSAGTAIKLCRPAIPARYPSGPWPIEMRADMVAAYLDYRDIAELAAEHWGDST